MVGSNLRCTAPSRRLAIGRPVRMTDATGDVDSRLIAVEQGVQLGAPFIHAQQVAPVGLAVWKVARPGLSISIVGLSGSEMSTTENCPFTPLWSRPSFASERSDSPCSSIRPSHPS